MTISSFTPITTHDDRPQSTSIPLTVNVSPMEAESIISSIKTFPIQEIGSSAFLKMYGFEIEKLSLQAHASALNSSSVHQGTGTGSVTRDVHQATTIGGEDEYVIDLILTHEKVEPLVETLLAVEAWRLFILKSNFSNTNNQESCNDSDLGDNDDDNDTSNIHKFAQQGNSLRVAFILHVETTIVSLLTLLFYRKENVLEIETNLLLSIVDYCARQMSSLAAPLSTNDMVKQQKEPYSLEEIKANALNSQGESTVEDIIHNLLQTEYQTAVNATSLARYLCEHFDSFPISIQSRMINTHDYLMIFIPLIDEPPWTRRRSKSIIKPNKSSTSSTSSETITSTEEVLVWEKYVNQEWKEIAPSELLQITQCEAQCWIAVFYLTCGNAKCHEQYGLNTYRKEQILRIRKFLNEYMTDQIPVLVDVIRYMEELSLMSVPDYNGNSNTGFGTMLMEQVDQVREHVLDGCTDDWKSVFNLQFDTIFSKVDDSNDEDLSLISNIYDEAISRLEDSQPVVHSQPNTLTTTPKVLKQVTITLTCDGCDVVEDKANSNDDLNEVYQLTLGDESVIIQTPKGQFKRNKLIIMPNGDIDSFTAGSSKTNIIKIQAEITFQQIVGVTKLGSELKLSKSNHDTEKTQWIQMGKLENDLVLQLGFRKIGKEDGVHYSLVQAFMAHPCDE